MELPLATEERDAAPHTLSSALPLARPAMMPTAMPCSTCPRAASFVVNVWIM